MKIGPGNPDFEDMSILEAFLRMMPPEQLAFMLQLTNERLAAGRSPFRSCSGGLACVF